MNSDRYLDPHGRSHQPILLEWQERALVIKDLHGKRLAQWHYQQIKSLGTDGEFAPAKAQRERLRLVDETTSSHLRLKLSEQVAYHPLLRRESMGAFAIIATVLGFWLAWPPVADRLMPLIPKTLFESLGQASLAAIQGEGGVCPLAKKSEAQAALSALLTRLELTPQKVVLLNDAEINAFALPGGTIVVMRGLLDKATTPEELAGVIAHEAGHVHFQHPERGLLRQSGLSLFLGLVLGGDFIGQLSQQALATKYSRDFEREADRYALDKLQQARVNPAGLADFYGRIRQQSDSSTLSFDSWLSTHPLPEEREAKARAAAKTIKPGAPILTGREWQALQAACRQ
jgi:Zn-dependent protease with chaperone function